MATSLNLVRRTEPIVMERLMAEETWISDSLDLIEAAVLTALRRTLQPASPMARMHAGYRYHHHLLDEGLVMDGLNIIGSAPTSPTLISSGAAGYLVKTEVYQGDDDQDHCPTSSCCAVCLEDFSGGMQVSRLSCCHIFHGACIGKWFLRKSSCPLCRRELPC